MWNASLAWTNDIRAEPQQNETTFLQNYVIREVEKVHISPVQKERTAQSICVPNMVL